MLLDEIIAGVVVFRQVISSDHQTRNHFLMILCAGLQLHANKIWITV